jgi:hypothetical protein
VTAEDQAGENIFFQLLAENAEALERDQIGFEGTPSTTAPLGSGIPEITSIILALGSSGAFTALAIVLRKYFDRRPQGSIKFEQTARGHSKRTTITIENCDADQVAKNLKGLLESKT